MATTKECVGCHQNLELSRFEKLPSGNTRNLCHSCRNRASWKRLSQEKKEGLRTEARRRYAKDSTPQKSASMKWKHGIDMNEYEEILQSQGGGCALCGTRVPGGMGRFHVDHRHSCCPTEKTCGRCIRGLLCFKCNLRLGFFESFLQETHWMNTAKEYLKKWGT